MTTTITPLTMTGITSTLYVTVRRRLALCAVVAMMVPLAAHFYHRCLAVGAELNQGQPFYELEPATTANFVTRPGTDIHLLSYFVIEKNQTPKTMYTLQLSFLANQRPIGAPRVVQLPIATDEAAVALADGATLAQVHLLPLFVPNEATILRIKSPDGRVVLRANQLLPNHGSPEELLLRSGRQIAWFTDEELRGLGDNGWTALPALYDLPTVKLPLLAQLEDEVTADDPMTSSAPLRIEPHRALVFNVTGPGKMTVLLKSDEETPGRFQIDHIGPRGAGRIAASDGHTTLNLPAGPSSVIMQSPDGHGATVHLLTSKLHTLGRADELMVPSTRLGSAYRLLENQPVRWSFESRDGNLGPVRITVHALDATAPGTLTWRLLDAHDHELRTGSLPLASTYDLFTAIMVNGNPADLGTASKIFLTPASDAAVLEVSADGAIINVETLLEDGAEPLPLAPYDEPLGPLLRWHDAPVRGPRWVMLRPLSLKSEQRQLYAATLRTPRIEGIGPLPRGPWISVTPLGVPEVARILEPAEHPSAAQDIETLVTIGEDAAMVFLPDGKHARRVVLTCDLADKLGGELQLRIDGRKVAKAAILTSNVRLTANLPAGVHRIRVDGAPPGECMVAARPESGKVTVRRSVYLMPDRGGLTVQVKPHGNTPLRLHYAIYSEDAQPHTDLPFAVSVDGGSPRRRVGSSATFTIAKANQLLHFAPRSVPLSSPAAGHALQAIAVSAVQLGEDLPAGNHRVKLRPPASGRYWARFWIEGRRHRLDSADSIITTDASEKIEVEQ